MRHRKEIYEVNPVRERDWLRDDVSNLRDRVRRLENIVVRIASFIESHTVLDDKISKEILALIVEELKDVF